MSLLNVQNLTMRFGGLTAVDRLDLKVESGQVFSVIGPNGAGKTTVFNAITGIYEPTAGVIALDGRPLRRPVTWRFWILAALVAVLTALSAVAICSDVDGLWHATIVQNYDFGQQKFNTAEAWHDLWGYLAGKLEIKAVPGKKFAVIEPGGVPLLGAAANKPTRETAQQLLEEVRKIVELQQPIEPVSRDGRWAILSADGSGVLVSYAGQDTAQRYAAALESVRTDQAKRKRAAWIALFSGLAFGFAGTWVIWNRSRRTADVIALAGIARTFQNIRLFANMTVLENVLIGLDRMQSRNVLSMMLRTPGIRRQEAMMCNRARESLEFVGLQGAANQLANSLAYGDQRRLEIARALATEPKLMLLDEPAAGMNPSETVGLMDLIRRIRDRGITVLLIEHHMNVVMGISDCIAVLDYGQKIAEGKPEVVRHDPKVIEAYLGKEENEQPSN